ncbi:hypothetical protein HNV11_07910 [Spirosoma taeanense]|uniref:Lipoprotein n=1 Tax=Spirosoma taeanense TaxID=2735870 RepID=A0A6M5Y754_9BACT|nr:hypothetical protein [Spirosoma taeanense]QJW89314.1 hypothetical protein HNV11_07910 [Spirosoma taeanense]
MKIKTFVLCALPAAFLMSCFQGDNGNPTDDANDAAGTGSAYLAREVTGVWLLSTDHRFGYDEPCNQLSEGFVQSVFNLGLHDEMETLDYQNGCEFRWSGGSAAIGFGGPKPYPSIYHAAYTFNKMFQGDTSQVYGQMGSTSGKPAYTGPETEGTGAERPAIEPEGGANGDIDEDASAMNDSSNRVSGITPAATQFVKPAVSTGKFIALSNIGDKAVWEPAKNTMHVLYNNHIINVRVNIKGGPAVQQQKAKQLAGIIMDHFNEDYADWN